MKKLLTCLAAASSLTLLASAAQACDWHNDVSASAEQSRQSVSMSTHSGSLVPAPASEEALPVEATAAPVCAADDEDCFPASR